MKENQSKISFLLLLTAIVSVSEPFPDVMRDTVRECNFKMAEVLKSIDIKLLPYNN